MGSESYRISRKIIFLSAVLFCLAFVWLVLPHPSHAQAVETPQIETADAPSQTFTVTNTNASGAGSLAQAIMDANANPGLDTIAFNIAGSGIKIIYLSAVLPTITSPVVIDGTTQPGYAGTPLIALSGQSQGQALNITAGGSTIKGMSFTGFLGTTSNIITMSGSGGNVITGCDFGIFGDNSRPSTSATAILIDGSSNNRIGGTTAAERNYFVEDSGQAMIIRNGAASNRVTGNWFGVGPNNAAMTTPRDTIRIEGSPNNTIGGSVGTTPGGSCTGECNVITGTLSGNGVYINGAAATGNRVIGNFIGLFPTGLSVNRNALDGVKIDNAPSNFVGGTTIAERNVITGNTFIGIEVVGAGSTGNVITGNYVGLYTDGTGTPSSATSSFTGIVLNASGSTRIGGTTAGERNVISGNRTGINISTNNCLVEGNYIGTDASGANRSTTQNGGITIQGNNNMIGGTTGTTLGGACTGACNVISGNGLDGASHGILVTGSTGNHIDANYIGLNAAGTAAILNGITPDGMTFNGDAIQLFNSSNNIIGRLSSAMRPTAEFRTFSGDNSPATLYCIKDDRTGDYIRYDDVTMQWQAKHCESGLTLTGTARPDSNGIIRSDLSSSPMNLSISPPQGGGLFVITGPRGPGQGQDYIPVSVRDSNISVGSCDCMRPNFQYIVGPVDIGGDTGSNNDIVENNVLGTTVSTFNQLNTAPHNYKPIVISNGNHDLVKDSLISAFGHDGITITNGTGNTIGPGIDWTLYQGYSPISLLPAGNGDVRPPTINAVNRLPGGSVQVTGSVAGEPPNSTIRIRPYRELINTVSDSSTNLNVYDLGITFDITTNGSGAAVIDQTFSDLDANTIRTIEKLKATATVVTQPRPDQPSTVLGSTSVMSAPVVVPKPLFDFDNDGKTDIAVVRPGATASDRDYAYLLYSHDNSIGVKQFGIGEDKLVTGDYYGDQIANFAVWRPSTQFWFISRPTGDPATNFDGLQWGLSTDVPVVGDFDNDGRNDLAVFRPSNGVWYIRSSLSGDLIAQQWGLATDKLVPADYNGDGRSDIAVYRNGIWYISVCPTCSPRIESFGLSTDIPVPADYDGDGIADIAVFRPSTGVWYVQGSTAGFYAIQWGQNGDKPLLGDFDGDGKADIAVWRPTDGNWYILQSSNGAFRSVHWGQTGDVPIPAR
jgi:hypothetical protein